MNPVAWNVLLALAWMSITGRFSLEDFVLGMAVGFVALMASQRVPGVPHYTRRTYRVLLLAGYLVWEILLANIRVSRDIVVANRMRPALVSVPIRSRTDLEITLLTALYTLTPGSTLLDIGPDGTHVLVHVTNLPAGGPDQVRRDITEGLERRILEVLR